jgi:GNAT superfamily N-acetyltransferase
VSAVRYTSSLEGIGEAHLSGGFWVDWPARPTAAAHLALLRGSEAAVLALDGDGQVIGFVTAVGDGVLAASIPLLEVLPAWQGQGIGSELVRRILDALGPRYMVDLVCDEDLVPFYERLGLAPSRAMIRRDQSEIPSRSLTRRPKT